MPNWFGRRTDRTSAPPPPTPPALTAAAHLVQAVEAGRSQLVPHYESWQHELWTYYETVGEFTLATTWRANMISRVRLRAAKLTVGTDEPQIQDTGRAAELVNDLYDGIGGQAEMMSTMTTLLDVPAECWLTGETVGNHREWRVRSTDELRARGEGYEVVDDASTLGTLRWRDLGDDHLVVRIWRPHKRFRHQAFAPAKAARGALRELDLVNRHIQAQYLSRLASAGIVVFPDEITFPTRAEFKDEPDPFITEWIETAKEALNSPGSAAAIVPIPMRVPGEYVDKVKHLDFTLKLDEKIIEKRDSARHSLAAQLNVPTDLLFDATNVNHWNLWHLEESGIKAYLSPDVELIVDGLTRGYLWPLLRAEGVPDWRSYVVWYDVSEIQARPDRSANALKVYELQELSGKALRREAGFDEDDAPDDRELEQQVLRRLAVNPNVGFLALHELTGFAVPAEATADVNPDPSPDQVERDQRQSRNQPVEQGAPPVADDAAARVAVLAARALLASAETEVPTFADVPRGVDANLHVLQGASRHVVELTHAGSRLRHPLLCQPRLFSCPFTHAVQDGIKVHPGHLGSYEAYLNADGSLCIGARTFANGDELVPAVNGFGGH